MDDVKEIISKFTSEEAKIDKLLAHIEPQTVNQLNKASSINSKIKVSYEEVIKRNKQILKDLETVKGNLRSKAIYSPSEMQWEQVCKNYRSQSSLQVTTYKCHSPVFV